MPWIRGSCSVELGSANYMLHNFVRAELIVRKDTSPKDKSEHTPYSCVVSLVLVGFTTIFDRVLEVGILTENVLPWIR